MKFKKIMIILIMALFFISIAGVSAGDAEDAIAISEDTAAMEVAQSDELTASDDSNAMEQSDDEELILEDNDVDKPMLGEGASTGSFTDLNDLINNQYSSNDTITLSCNYTFNGNDDDDSSFIHGISINRGVTIDGNGCTIDGSQKARIFNIGNGGTVNFLNINFINGNATGSGWEVHGGAISAPYLNCVVEGCNFTNNTADNSGGALMRVTAYNCVFTGNTADLGGAINGGSAYNCVFTGNTANHGGAIYTGRAYNCVFTGNTADLGGAINGGSAYNCTFTGNTARYGGAIVYVSAYNCTFTGNTARYGGAIYFGSAYNCTFTGNTAGYGGAMMGNEYNPEEFSATLCMFDSNTLDNCMYIRIVEAVLSADNLTTSYKSGDRLLFNLTADNTNYVGFNTTIKIYQDEQPVGTYYALSGEGWIVDLSPGTYNAVLSLDSYPDVKPITTKITITVNKLQTQLTANAITTTYNINKDLVITLKDANGNVLSGVSVTVDLNGAKTYITDKNGQVRVSTKGLAPKTYTAKITFNGNTNYAKSTKDVKVTVKKATPKLTAKKKTFKNSVKTKKYTVTLKDNTGKAIKKAKVTLKVKGKTYKATTNSKGKAVFKIKNLKKKGKYTAVIKFKGNKYYNKATKKAKIKVIITFKTVSKGSKDKSTVKKIQRALKDHGYYLSYKGHYLKVDGKFKGCTERSVKEFQKDKGLKVTGKVDEKTAKKLGILS